jgi:hypothetical protein
MSKVIAKRCRNILYSVLVVSILLAPTNSTAKFDHPTYPFEYDSLREYDSAVGREIMLRRAEKDGFKSEVWDSEAFRRVLDEADAAFFACLENERQQRNYPWEILGQTVLVSTVAVVVAASVYFCIHFAAKVKVRFEKYFQKRKLSNQVKKIVKHHNILEQKI